MEIRFCGPAFFTNNAAPVLEQFGTLGFEIHHKKENLSKVTVFDKIYVLKDSHDNIITITEGDCFTKTHVGVRLNVDNFKEAVAHFEGLGYANMMQKDGSLADTGTSLATLMRSPEGAMVSLAEHF